MEVLFGVFVVFAWIGIFLLMRLVTTFLHEMGHAIPALLFTDQPVGVFVGSYGDESRSYGFKLGRLKLWFAPRIAAWNMGMCRADRTGMSFSQICIHILGGPIASVLVGGVALWTIIRYSANEVIFVIVAAFLLSAVWDLFINLLPNAFGSSGLHGPVLMSDGMQLMLLLRERRLPADYHEYAKQVEAEDYQPLISRIEMDMEAGTVDESLLPLAVRAYEASGEYGGALSIYEYWHQQQPLRPENYDTLGRLYHKLGNFQEAINCYGEYLHEFYTDYSVLHARGQCYQQLAEHGAAIQEFTVSLRYNDQQAEVWRDRAYSLLRLNQFEDAESDLEIAAKLEPEHPRWYLYQSIWLESKGHYGEAHSALLKAKELGDDFHGLEFRLSELERRL